MLKSIRRFQDLFADESYVLLKNHLYNYLLRKRAVNTALQDVEVCYVLEIGSGMSPVTVKDTFPAVVYSDLSLEALRILQQNYGGGWHVAADGTDLPFKSGTFGAVVCSEVLEHLDDDRRALGEMSRVLQPGGTAIITFPHRHFYFAWDDRFVHHIRRYEIAEMTQRLVEAGMEPVKILKVLGPLEKITMITVLFAFSAMGWLRHSSRGTPKREGLTDLLTAFFKGANRFYAGLAWLDARVFPRSLAAVLLIKAVKRR
jgi:SAM-dependent methyltransferase